MPILREHSLIMAWGVGKLEGGHFLEYSYGGVIFFQGIPMGGHFLGH